MLRLFFPIHNYQGHTASLLSHRCKRTLCFNRCVLRRYYIRIMVLFLLDGGGGLECNTLCKTVYVKAMSRRFNSFIK